MNERKNTWLGVSAVVLSVIAWLLLGVLLGVFVYVDLFLRGGIDGLPEDSPVNIVGGLLAIVAMLFAAVALILAVAGLISKRQSKWLPLTALAFSLSLYFVIGGLFVIGTYFTS